MSLPRETFDRAKRCAKNKTLKITYLTNGLLGSGMMTHTRFCQEKFFDTSIVSAYFGV